MIGQPIVTAIGAGTTYPDYKPAPFIVGSTVAGVDTVTVVTEGIFSYCGVKVKIDTDRHLGAERAVVRAAGEPVGHVTTGEYGSQMLSLGGVHHLTGSGKRTGRVACDTLLALCNGGAVELSVDDGATVMVQAGAAPVIDGAREERMRVGCGSAAIGMFARQWQDLADEVVVVDDHITGVLTEHQAGKLLGMAASGLRMGGRRSTPGRYFEVARPGRGWGGTDIADPLSILGAFDPAAARPGLRLLMVSTTGEHSAWFVLDDALRPVRHELPAAVADSVARVRENCEPALCSVLFMGGRRRVAARGRHRQSGAADAIGGARDHPRHLRRRAGLPVAGRRHHLHGGRDPAARRGVRQRADPGAGGSGGVHPAPRRLCRAGRPHGGDPASGRGVGAAARDPVPRSAVTRLRARMLPDRRRLHLSDGPIELVLAAEGGDLGAAYDAATRRAATVLDELCAELALLRSTATTGAMGAVARRMQAAVAPHTADGFITPMAAVAGAVAEAVLDAMRATGALHLAWVNNGGDIAVHLGPGAAFSAAMVSDPVRGAMHGAVRIDAAGPVRGVATSGWRGRSHSLGIADAVTVLAASAPEADAAATVVANAVDLPGHGAVARAPACRLMPDSDLGDRLVTTGVGALSEAEVGRALDRGAGVAAGLLRRGLLHGAALHLAGQTRLVGDAALGQPAVTRTRCQAALR